MALVTVATAIWVARSGRTIEGLSLVAGIVLLPFAVDIAKEFFDRPRPLRQVFLATGMAFPSGHTANATAYLACGVVLVRCGFSVAWRLGAVGIATAILVAVGSTRIYLRNHFLSDVLGGAALGVAVFALCGIGGLLVAYLRHNAGRVDEQH